MTTRRAFLQAAGGAVLAFAQTPSASSLPWHRRTLRWGQTNITEKDPERYDIPWWRAYWKRTQVQGVIINAGGIVAYYPSKFPLHHRAEFLKGRDLFGELAKAAHDDGLAVLARMDSNRAAEDFYRAHPDWFAVDASGRPYRAAEKYIACISGPYYEEYLPGVLREIIERSHPEGFTDNSWAGLGRDSICHCPNCARRFREYAGKPLPARADWDDAIYRQWILWSYARRLEIWDLNNRTTQAAGGPDCVWIGMNSGSVTAQSRSFRDLKEICRRAPMLLLDHQRRSDAAGFQQNTETGKLVHGLLGWDKLAPESMAMYQSGSENFRLAAKPAAEARMWMLAGFAGGIQPWWHHVGAWHEDRRAYRTAEPVMRWHKANEQYLVNRHPVASVGLVWSQRNTDFYGRNNPENLIDLPWRGIGEALLRARVPYVPVHADFLERDGKDLAVLILPNLGAMSDEQCGAVRRFVARGGSLIATGASSLYTEMGDPRPDFALADVFGVHAAEPPDRRWADRSIHTYLRIEQRHPVLAGFEETDILPFGGRLAPLKADPGASVLLTFIPESPVYPPETAWMRQPKTDIPGLVVREPGKGGRIAYLAADIDRQYGRHHLPDHAHLLANLVRWAAGDSIPLAVEGHGFVDCQLYAQPGRLILHLVNLNHEGAWRSPLEELTPIGPLKVKVRVGPDRRARTVRLLVSGETARVSVQGGWAAFDVKTIVDHEVAVVGLED